MRSCVQLSSRYGATLPTRHHPACRCNLAPSSPVDILVRPGGSGNATNYDQKPSFRRHGTSCPCTVFLNSSPTAHLLAPLENISRPIPIFTIIPEHGTAASVKRSCKGSAFRRLRRSVFVPVRTILHHTDAASGRTPRNIIAIYTSLKKYI